MSIFSKDGWKTAAVTGAIALASTFGYAEESDAQTIHRKNVPMEDGYITFIYDNDEILDFGINSSAVVGDESGLTDISYTELFGEQHRAVLEQVYVPDDIDQDNVGVSYDDEFDQERAERLIERYAHDLAMLEQAEDVLSDVKESNEYQVINEAQDRYVGLVNERLQDYGIAIEELDDEADSMYQLVATR